jgi:membrane protease YdiL (CAAX protease family)
VGISSDFLYLLLFEAFAVQLWLFGTFFRSVADWRGPLTAAVSSGIVFGAVSSFLFLEADYQGTLTITGVLYFLAWGLFYGMVRLRTGSIIGAVAVQAMQSLTAWHIFLPLVPPNFPQTYNSLYIGMGMVYMILVWRLWPNEEEDYRV